MKENTQYTYDTIAKAIEYIKQNFKKQPSLDELAKHVHLSPFHFQRLFSEWAGVSPKKFIQYLSVDYAKSLLKEKQASLFDATYHTGLSSTSRLHELFVNIEGMSPMEYKNHGKGLLISFSFYESAFGKVIAANTQKGICYLAFYEDETIAIAEMKKRFSAAEFHHQSTAMQASALQLFHGETDLPSIKLHLKGTPFQLKVWQALLSIPQGQLISYGNLAQKIETEKASRAVGTAIGSNPIAYLIPCHRVIQSTGNIGGYMWGETRKNAIIAWEASKNNPDKGIEL